MWLADQASGYFEMWASLREQFIVAFTEKYEPTMVGEVVGKSRGWKDLWERTWHRCE
jgi:hypothetical protein